MDNKNGARPAGDAYDRLLKSSQSAAERVVAELGRRYFDVGEKSPSQVVDLIMRGKLRKRLTVRGKFPD